MAGLATRGRFAAAVAKQLGLSRALRTTACAEGRRAPLGPMPNEDIDVRKLDELEKYRSYTPYYKRAEAERIKHKWWKTYRDFMLYNGAKVKPDENGSRRPVDIGLPHLRPARAAERLARRTVLRENRRNADLERAARMRTLKIPLDEVRADWEKTTGPQHIHGIVSHYGIYRDMYKGAEFVPRVMLRVAYALPKEDATAPVYYGNVLMPFETQEAPEVTFEANEDSLWTLILTNLDGHLQDNESEYLHWFVGNIPGGRVSMGQTVCHYLTPFPAKGTGYHRLVFLLYKQEHLLDFGTEIRPEPCRSLKERTFRTFDFYKKHEDDLTPAGIAFFQSHWDESVTDIFHNTLDMREPVFEYDWPKPYHPPQVKYPHKKTLRYLDLYRESNEPTYGNH
ncbi:large ribosomal subunit protein mL38 [Lethenteron reissneri]|uniref:large ribosomal subunit protein mL38 n=1 Tax=Lethenteron reissneri TaxID=7753 RepID=UPI002AB6BE8F|nr:large ribosomal subunit protein mL38 [Lethenteron reissneri]